MKKLLVPLGLVLALAACTAAPEPEQAPTSGGFTIPVPTGATVATGTVTSNPGLSEVKCSSANNGEWSFTGVLTNSSDKEITYTIALAVTVGNKIEGHELITEIVPAQSKVNVAEANFATSTDPAAVCAPVTSMNE